MSEERTKNDTVKNDNDRESNERAPTTTTTITTTTTTPSSTTTLKDPRFFPMNEKEEISLKELRNKTGDTDKLSSDAALLRFLRARGLDVPKAFSMWEKWVSWRKEYSVDNITAMSVSNEVKAGKAYW